MAPGNNVRRARIVLAALSTLVMAGPLTAAPAMAQSTIRQPTAPALPVTGAIPSGLAPGSYTITLITGDRVVLTVDAGGRYTTSVSPGTHVQTMAGPDGVFVYPDAALPAIQRGQLDRTLFNVSYLAANGFADSKDGRLPIIVTYPQPSGRARAADRGALAQRADALPATSAPVGLFSVNGAAVKVEKKAAREFWQALNPAAPAAGTARSGSLAQGVSKVWLDRPVKVNLAESVPLIGAPEAWNAGYDGTGVKVAVLDTGIDANHPDLAGRVIGSKSFVPDVTSVADGHGHGTHVASTIAGSGSASGEARKGVAPGARLLVGKVLSDAGQGSDSEIVAGMQWAAEEQDADIVSMSLGGGPTDGTDVMSQAVDNLTASTGALFVIAAGNSGPDKETVGTPGAATSALTVAATDKTDGLADFSSRGPRLGDEALKPDIAAPGVAIVAARAAGTTMGTPVDDKYTSASGTSMATPHVAGAAAILAQRHPDWSAAELKAGLMSTAKDVGHTVYERGAGRLDVARAVKQEVVATTGNVDFGQVELGSPKITRQIGYRNSSAAPVTLTLAPALTKLAGETPADGALTTDRTLTIPAGGTATATVTLDVADLGQSGYSGAVVATDAATGTRLTTPVGFFVGPKKVTVTIRTLDRAGLPIDDRPVELGGRVTGFAPWASEVVASDVPGEDAVDVTAVEPGVERMHVVPGTYSIWRMVRWWDDDDAENYVDGILLQPQVTVTADTEVVLDARKVRKVSFEVSATRTTPRVYGPTNLRIEVSRWDGQLLTSGARSDYITPTQQVTKSTFRVAFEHDMTNAQVTASVRGPRSFDLHPESWEHADQGLPMGIEDTVRKGGYTPFPAGRHSLDVVDVGFATPADLAKRNVRGKLALVQWGDDRRGEDGKEQPDGIAEAFIWTDRIANLRKAGAAGAVLFPNPPANVGRNSAFTTPAPYTEHFPEDNPQTYGIPVLEVKRSVGLRLLDRVKAGKVTIDVQSDPNVRAIYHLNPTMDQRVSDNLTFTYRPGAMATVRSDTHGSGPLTPTKYTTMAWKPGTFLNQVVTVDFAVPKRGLVEYFGPLAPDVLYRSFHIGEPNIRTIPRVFDKPVSISEQRNATPFLPGAIGIPLDARKYPPPPGAPTGKHEYCAMCRHGDRFMPTMQIVGGDGDYLGSAYDVQSRLYAADGKEVPRTTFNGLPIFVLPPESGRYRFVQNADEASTTWTFTSSTAPRDTLDPNFLCASIGLGWPGGCRAEPFLFLRYDLGRQLGMDNTVPAGKAHLFDVTAYHNPQATERVPDIAGMRLWTSTDGKQWKPVLLVPGSSSDGKRTFHAITTTPNQPGATVRLKAEAWDRAGNRIEQTVNSAFTLSGRR